MKRNVSASLYVWSIAVGIGLAPGAAIAQTVMIVQKKDATVVKIPVSEIASITFSDSAAGDAASTVRDADGNVYKTVKIGGQIWMAENLRTTRTNRGAAIPVITDKKEWSNASAAAMCWYDNDESAHKATRGALYNWHAVASGDLCPTGWHVPTDAEWDLLTAAVGPANRAAAALKAAGTAHWTSPNAGATNESGFTAVGGGYRNSVGSFNSGGGTGLWWTSTPFGAKNVATRAMWYNNSTVGKGDFPKVQGISVRCLMD